MHTLPGFSPAEIRARLVLAMINKPNTTKKG